MDKVYGYVNGKPTYSRDEFIFKSRGFEEITSDEELINFAKKVTSNWYDSGQSHTFVSYYLGDYALNEPKRSLTDKEFNRLKELQQIAKDEYKAEQAKYKYELYEGRPMTESEVRMFLDKHIEDAIKHWGESHFYTEQAREYKDKAISKFRNGEVICVDSYEFVDKFGSGLGSFDKALYSDGTIRDHCYGSLD